MMKKITLLLALFLTIQSNFAQSDLDQYKYVIVPTTFDFCNEPDEYQLNSISKFLFKKQGFEVLMDNERLPQDLINNGCLALWADVLKESSMFITKLKIELRNCQKDVVFTSEFGESRDKKYAVAYNFALREAFESFNTVQYSYKPTKVQETTIATPAVVVTAVPETLKTETPVSQEPAVAVATQSISEAKTSDASQALTARKKDVINYDLLNDKGDVVYTLIFSGKEEFYMVEGMQATVYKLNDAWVIAKTVADGSLQVQTLNVNF